MKFGVIVFPGSNCDQDCFYVLDQVLKEKVETIWHKDTQDLSDFDCIIVPGGFSYGDYLRTGAIARFSPVIHALCDYAKQGGLVLGICNGFQILLECGLLPGAMLKNTSLKFICKYVNLRVKNNQTPFTLKCQPGQVLRIPIAHAEGNYFLGLSAIKSLQEKNQIVFQYCDLEGQVNLKSNPNGSLENIAGIMNDEGNVLGMMPHPERCSESVLGSVDGLIIFQSIIQYLKEKKTTGVRV